MKGNKKNEFQNGKNKLVSNVTANEISDKEELKGYLLNKLKVKLDGENLLLI